MRDKIETNIKIQRWLMINEKQSKIDAATLKLLQETFCVDIDKDMYSVFRGVVYILHDDIMFDKKKLEDFKNEYFEYGKSHGWK